MLSLTAGAVLLGLSIVLIFVLRWGYRQPNEPRWMRDILVGSCYVPLVVALLAFGLASLIQFAAGIGA